MVPFVPIHNAMVNSMLVASETPVVPCRVFGMLQAVDSDSVTYSRAGILSMFCLKEPFSKAHISWCVYIYLI